MKICIEPVSATLRGLALSILAGPALAHTEIGGYERLL